MITPVFRITAKNKQLREILDLMARKQPNETIGHILAKQKVGR